MLITEICSVSLSSSLHDYSRLPTDDHKFDGLRAEQRVVYVRHGACTCRMHFSFSLLLQPTKIIQQNSGRKIRLKSNIFWTCMRCSGSDCSCPSSPVCQSQCLTSRIFEFRQRTKPKTLVTKITTTLTTMTHPVLLIL